jgi:hypothetical protein
VNDVLQRWVGNKVAFWENVELRARKVRYRSRALSLGTYLFRLQVEPYSMVFSYSMPIGITAASSSLKVLSAHETAVNVDIGERF